MNTRCAYTQRTITDLETGAVYSDKTGLSDLNPEQNGSIEAESFGNYDLPALLAIIGKSGTYEATGILSRTDGTQLKASKTVRVAE